MSRSLAELLDLQVFPNEYQLVDGDQMHADNPEQFHIPPAVIKRQISVGQFVELRVDSPRFSVHDGAAEVCSCPACHGTMTKPILRHEHPQTLSQTPDERPPSRGWGEDFWVRVTRREGDSFQGIVDNRLVESRLHEITLGMEIVFHNRHILALHPSHHQDLLTRMNAADLMELWESMRRTN